MHPLRKPGDPEVFRYREVPDPELVAGSVLVRPDLTITSAAVSPVSPFRPPPPPGQQAVPVQYVFWITLPAADAPALTAVTTAVTGPPPQRRQGPPTTGAAAASALTISVAGRTWVLTGFATRFTGRQFEVSLPSRSQALQLHRILVPTG